MYGPPPSRRRITLGEWGSDHDGRPVTADSARKRASEIIGEWRLGRPTLPRSRRATFGTHAAAWLGHAEARKKAPEVDRRYIGIATKRWGSTPLEELTQGQIVEAMKDVARQNSGATPAGSPPWSGR